MRKVSKKSSSSNNLNSGKPLIELHLDKLSTKRATIFDQAVLSLFRLYRSNAADHNLSVESPKLLETAKTPSNSNQSN